jgi:uncharacterized protein YdaU (DUF1376 family)
VNFYKRYIGDIQAKTGGLSLAEFGAYDRLLDHYYATEKPLPTDLTECHRIARAMSKDERRAVDRVIGKFFLLTDIGYVQSKAEEVLAEALPKIEAARSNGAKGGRPKKTHKEPNGLLDIEPSGFYEETHGSENAKAIQNQSLDTSPKGDVAAKPPPTPAIGLKTYIAKCKAENRKPVPPDHPIRTFCADTGITDEMIQIAWIVFKERHLNGERVKRYKDWARVFANSIEGRWYGLWFTNAEGVAEWTSTGLQKKRALDAKAKRQEEGELEPA